MFGCFYIKRMIPPKCRISFYFTTDGISEIVIAKNYERYNLKVIFIIIIIINIFLFLFLFFFIYLFIII